MNLKTSFIADPIAVFWEVAHKVRDEIVSGNGQGRQVVDGRQEGYRSWDPQVLAGDRIAEDLIFERLREEGCEVTVISEEAGLLSFPIEGLSPDARDGYFLIMDPLDGSILYERDVEAFWAISMGLWQGSRHVATLVMDLTSGRTWRAEPGKVEEAGGRGAPAHRAARASRLADAYVATYLMKPHYLGPVVEKYAKVLLSSRFVLPIGGALAWTYVASGRIDAYIPLNQPLTEVYSAMGVAKEAGCIITDFDGNEPKLVPDIHRRYSLVCTRDAGLHQEILQLLKEDHTKGDESR